MSDFAFENWADDQISRLQTSINIRRPSEYQPLFKYISLASEASWEHLSRTLHSSELTGSVAANLNDPFEVLPCVFDDLNPDVIAEAVGHNALLERLQGTGRTVGEIFADRQRYVQQAGEYLIDISSRYRIVSFSERSDSALLWAHYSNSYQGTCLHFLPSGFEWHQRLNLGYVSYSQYRPTYPLSLALALSSKRSEKHFLRRAESEKTLFSTKSTDWSYEAEVRLVYEKKETSSVRFKPCSLVSIILGPRFSDEGRSRLMDLLRGTTYDRISVRRARLSKTTFSVEIDDPPLAP
ncbi:DUF2971 domain-containing protein [Bradyrhizobium sp. BR 1432]|uniref:DUF2971 domain-containing protein n=1 Tax=Bradyrhizobium sp. BR 1432 TaxID=3447966 RepID=UPI003EE6CB87